MKRLGGGAALLVGALALFSVAAASSAAPKTATPVLTTSAVIARVGGHVTYKRAGSSKFVALTTKPTVIPFGTTIDAGDGTVRVTIATTTPGAPATALFYTGQFAITQDDSGIATLTLNGPLQSCPTSGATGPSGTTNGGRASASKKAGSTKRPASRSLWGNGGNGQFKTTGHYAAATVLGTVWLTTDSCTSTVVSVAEGQVSVTNLVTSSALSVTTGQALTVQSSGTTSTAPFSGPTSPPNYGQTVKIASNHTAVKLGEPYTLTATGTAYGPGAAYIYENVGSPCSHTLAAEQSNSVAYEFSSDTISGPGPFTLTAPALAQHIGTKYYCAYVTDPAAYAQVIVKVSAS